MNKTQVKEKINELLLTSKQYPNGDFKVGSEEQRNAALLIEQAYNANHVSFDMIPSLLLALKDIQIRDYVLGFINSQDRDTEFFFKELIKYAPIGYSDAPITLLALVYYEKHQNGKANEILRPVIKRGYTLAVLLDRVFTANWNANEFNKMRAVNHPLVTENIFGGSNDNSNS